MTNDVARRSRPWRRRASHAIGFFRAASGRRLGDAAAESAFFCAVAILPMLLTTTAVLRSVRPLLGRDALPAVAAGLSGVLRVVLTSRGTSAADAAQRLLTGTTPGLLGVGTLASVVLVTRAMRSVLTGLNAVFAGSGATTARGTWLRSALLALLAIALSAAITAVIAVGPLFGYGDRLDDSVATPVRVLWLVLRFPVGVAAIAAFVLVVHRVGIGPRTGACSRRSWRRAAIFGASASTAGIAVASVLLPIYVAVAEKVSPTIGALGGGLILLVWAYLICLALLVGAQTRARLTRAEAAVA